MGKHGGRTHSQQRNASHLGTCGVTQEGHEGNCASGNKGSWSAARLGLLTLKACADKSRGCARCTFVSFSATQDDCSWFQRCDLSSLLQLKPPWDRDFLSVHARLFLSAERNSDVFQSSWRSAITLNATTAPGVCASTLPGQEGNCDMDSLGTRRLGGAVNTIQDCLHACHRCPRCAYISFSSQRGECAWFAHCDLQDLRRPFPGQGDAVTVRVRKRPAEIP